MYDQGKDFSQANQSLMSIPNVAEVYDTTIVLYTVVGIYNQALDVIWCIDSIRKCQGALMCGIVSLYYT